MITYSNYKLPPGLEYIGDGFTIRKTTSCCGKKNFEFMQALCLHLIAHPDPMIVPIYAFQFINRNSDDKFVYSYDMQRLGIISEEVETLIWQVGDAWRAKINNPTHQFTSKAVSVLQPLTVEYAWEKYAKLMTFLEEVVKLGRYYDLHGSNVMVNNDGCYSIIDIEGFLNAPLSQPSNNWITKSK
jgi:hypothetical protein